MPGPHIDPTLAAPNGQTEANPQEEEGVIGLKGGGKDMMFDGMKTSEVAYGVDGPCPHCHLHFCSRPDLHPKGQGKGQDKGKGKGKGQGKGQSKGKGKGQGKGQPGQGLSGFMRAKAEGQGKGKGKGKGDEKGCFCLSKRFRLALAEGLRSEAQMALAEGRRSEAIAQQELAQIKTQQALAQAKLDALHRMHCQQQRQLEELAAQER